MKLAIFVDTDWLSALRWVRGMSEKGKSIVLRWLKRLAGRVLCGLDLHYVPNKCYIHECFETGKRRRIIVLWHGPCSHCGAEVQKILAVAHAEQDVQRRTST